MENKKCDWEPSKHNGKQCPVHTTNGDEIEGTDNGDKTFTDKNGDKHPMNDAGEVVDEIFDDDYDEEFTEYQDNIQYKEVGEMHNEDDISTKNQENSFYQKLNKNYADFITNDITKVKGSGFLMDNGDILHSGGWTDHDTMLKSLPDDFINNTKPIWINDGIRNGGRVATVSLPKNITDEQYTQLAKYINKFSNQIKIEIHKGNKIETFNGSQQQEIMNYIDNK